MPCAIVQGSGGLEMVLLAVLSGVLWLLLVEERSTLGLGHVVVGNFVYVCVSRCRGVANIEMAEVVDPITL